MSYQPGMGKALVDELVEGLSLRGCVGLAACQVRDTLLYADAAATEAQRLREALKFWMPKVRPTDASGLVERWRADTDFLHGVPSAPAEG